ncbi:PKD domain-containing protein [bacterium]|nr:PKD domain-containing protein [bacterium]
MRFRFLLMLVLLAALALLQSCGGSSQFTPMGSTELADQPAPVSLPTQGAWPDVLPADRLQPWESLHAAGYAVATDASERTAAGIDADSEFQHGRDYFRDGGDVQIVDEAARIVSGLPDANGVSYAMFRLEMAGAQPGVLSADINLHADGHGARSQYWLGIADYGAGCWRWLEPCDDAHGRFSLGAGDYLSGLGNAFACVVAYNGASFDVVGLGANPTNAADTTAPPQPTGLTATAIAGGLELQWNDVIDGELAGYRIYYSAAPFTTGTAAGVEQVGWLSGTTRHLLQHTGSSVTYVRVSAVDYSGNESPLSDQANAVPAAGTAPVVILTTDTISGAYNIAANLTATGANSYDWDLDGDGSYEVTNDTTGQQQVDTSRPGIIRPSVRGYGGDVGVAGGAVSLIITGNSRPVASAQAAPASGAIPLQVNFTGTGSDADGSIAEYAWDWDGDGFFDYSDALDPGTLYDYTTAGLFNAKFRVTDDLGLWDVDTVTIQAIGSGTNLPPVASFTATPDTGTSPLLVTVDASASYDDDGFIDHYYWDWDNDGVFDSVDVDPVATHTFTGMGVVSPRLVVEDNGLFTDDCWGTITLNSAPTAVLTITPERPYPGQAVNLDASYSSDLDGSITFYEWDLGGGFMPGGSSLDVPAGLPGRQPVMLRVTDDYGAQDAVEGVITSRGWQITPIIDTTSSFYGAINELEVVHGRPAIAYYDATNGQTHYVRANDADGATWGSPCVAAASAGLFWGSALDLEVIWGMPMIAFYDAVNGDLYVVCANDQEGATWQTPVLVDSNIDSGAYLDLECINGLPAICYYTTNGVNGWLNFNRATAVDGSSWGGPVIVDNTTAADVGYYCSMETVNGGVGIGYQDATNTNLMFVASTDANGSLWGAPVTVDNIAVTGYSIKLRVVDNQPALVYTDGSYWLLYVRALDQSGSTWPASQVVLDGSGNVQWLVAFDLVNDWPATCFNLGPAFELRYRSSADLHGINWLDNQVVDASTMIAYTGDLHEVNGDPALCYCDSAAVMLRYAKHY